MSRKHAYILLGVFLIDLCFLPASLAQQPPPSTTRIPPIANGRIMGNASGASAAPAETVLAPGAGIAIATSQAPNTITISNSSTITNPAVTATLTSAQWNACSGFVIENASQTLTLPAYSAISSNVNGCYWIQTIGITVTLAPIGSDTIKTGNIAGVNTSITIPADTVTVVSIDTSGWVLSLGPMQFVALSWGANQNLSTPTVGISIGRMATPRTVISINCRPDVVVGGTATLDIYAAASGVALNAGTKLNSTSCNANTGASIEQSMGVASASIPAGYWIGIVAAGAGWGSSAGFGAVNVSFR